MAAVLPPGADRDPLLIAPLTAYLPIASMQAYSFCGLQPDRHHHIRAIIRVSKPEAAVMTVTFSQHCSLNSNSPSMPRDPFSYPLSQPHLSPEFVTIVPDPMPREGALSTSS